MLGDEEEEEEEEEERESTILRRKYTRAGGMQQRVWRASFSQLFLLIKPAHQLLLTSHAPSVRGSELGVPPKIVD